MLLPLLTIGILVAAAMRIGTFFTPGFYPGVDESTYFLTARALATTGSAAIHSPDPLLFVPSMFIETEPGTFSIKYPIGYPLLVTVGYLVAGPMGAFAVNPVMGLLCVIGTMLLARELFGTWVAVVAGLCTALCPMIIYQSSTPLSHISDTTFVVFGLFMLWRWMRSGHWGYAVGAGLLLGYATTIRNTEALLGGVVVWAAVLRYRQIGQPNRVRRFILQFLPMAAAGILAITPMLILQWIAFGSPLRNGYDYTNESTAFAPRFFVRNLPGVLTMLNADPLGLPLLFPAAVVGLVLWLTGLATRSAAAVRNASPAVFVLLWACPTLLVYTAHHWWSPHAVIYLRLFVSVFPGVIIAAAATAEALARGRLAARVVFSGLLIAASIWAAMAAERVMGNRSDLALISNSAALTALESLPPRSLVIASDETCFLTAFLTDHEVIYPSMFDAAEVRRAEAVAAGDVLDLNPLRAQRYFAQVGGKDQAQLDQLLQQLILKHLDQGQRVGLLVQELDDDSPPRREVWAQRLAPSLALGRRHHGDSGWAVYEVGRR